MAREGQSHAAVTSQHHPHARSASRFKAGPLRLARLVSLILFLLLCGGWLVWLSRPRPCERCKWEDRLDADLASIEHHGVKEEDLALAARAACGGYIVRIENEELYAYPFGWEALPQFWEVRQKLPHNFLVMWTKMLCAYPGRVPDVTFVMNSFDKVRRQAWTGKEGTLCCRCCFAHRLAE